jgi:ribosomal protein S18 acetylase RimI-like enzyme
VVVRRAAAADAAAMAEVWLRSFTAALPTVRRGHDDDAVRAWFARVVVPAQEAWVAVTSNPVTSNPVTSNPVAGDTVVGLLVLDGGEIEQLYLDPAWRGRGVGDRFVGLAKRRCPDGLGLWTFQVNEPARRFYRRHGFVEVARTDGRRNEEREPDVRYQWRPASASRSSPSSR